MTNGTHIEHIDAYRTLNPITGVALPLCSRKKKNRVIWSKKGYELKILKVLQQERRNRLDKKKRTL